jgi:hypothetical protein
MPKPTPVLAKTLLVMLVPDAPMNESRGVESALRRERGSQAASPAMLGRAGQSRYAV